MSAQASDLIGYEVESDGVAVVTLRRPDKRNAWSAVLTDALAEALRTAGSARAVRAIVIAAEGPAFSAGGDLREIERGAESAWAAYDYVWDRVRWIEELANLPKPVVAAVNGAAFGAGLSLVLACDAAVVSEKASFSLAFVRVGAVPDAGCLWFLQRIVGLTRARELAFSGRVLDATEAAELGIVTRVVQAGTELTEARLLAAQWAGGPTVAMGLTKQLLMRGATAPLNAYLAEEAKTQALCFSTADHRAGLAAFLDKQDARFEGR